MHVICNNIFSQAVLKFSIPSELLQESTVNHATLKAKYISIAGTHGYADLQIDQVRSSELAKYDLPLDLICACCCLPLVAKPDSQTRHN